MKTIKYDFNPSIVEEYVKEIQDKLPQYKVDVNNVNDFATLLSDKKNCKACKGLDKCKNESVGYCTSYENDSFILEECRYKKEERIKNGNASLIQTLYLPTKILEAKLEDFHTNTESRKKIYAKIADIINKFNEGESAKGLYLYGTFSIGKTYTLACIANELAKNNVSCLLIYFPDLVVDLKNAMGTPRFEALINMLRSIDVLMLDDIGSENMTPWIRDDVLGPIINYRMLENKTVFISSNIKPGELKNHLAIDKAPSNVLKAERIISRLVDLVDAIDMDDGQKYKR